VHWLTQSIIPEHEFITVYTVFMRLLFEGGYLSRVAFTQPELARSAVRLRKAGNVRMIIMLPHRVETKVQTS